MLYNLHFNTDWCFLLNIFLTLQRLTKIHVEQKELKKIRTLFSCLLQITNTGTAKYTIYMYNCIYMLYMYKLYIKIIDYSSLTLKSDFWYYNLHFNIPLSQSSHCLDVAPWLVVSVNIVQPISPRMQHVIHTLHNMYMYINKPYTAWYKIILFSCILFHYIVPMA